MKTKHRLCRTLLPMLLAPGLIAAAILPLRAQAVQKALYVGQSEVYGFDRMTTAAIGSPLIADIVPLSAHQLMVSARSLGETTLYVCDHAGTHKIRVSVVPEPLDLKPVAALVQSAIGLPGVRASAVRDTLFLEGTVSGAVALQRASAIAAVYAPKVKNLLVLAPETTSLPTPAQTYAALLAPALAPLGITVQIVGDKTLALSGRSLRPPVRRSAAAESSGDTKTALSDSVLAETRPPDPLDAVLQSLPPDLKIINLINLASVPARQILVQAKVIDINRSAARSLGIDWGTGGLSAARGGGTYTFQPQPILFGQIGAATTFYSNPLGGGKLERVSPLAAQLNALITENKARILSEPSLLVLDGCDGSILVGGEIPIPVAQASSGTGGVSTSVTIEYKPYGVRLLVSAALIDPNTVQMTVTPEVSELDYGAGIQLSGFSVPALSVRRATSTVQMAGGETLVIGGLYSSTEARQVSRIPLLSQIPVLGEFFKSTTTHKEENELMILIQPQIVTPGAPGPAAPPGSSDNLPIPRIDWKPEQSK